MKNSLGSTVYDFIEGVEKFWLSFPCVFWLFVAIAYGLFTDNTPLVIFLIAAHAGPVAVMFFTFFGGIVGFFVGGVLYIWSLCHLFIALF